MYAIIRTGGKQYRVEPGFELLVEKLDVETGKTIVLDDVLFYADGEEVSALVLALEKGPKLRTIKYKRRHNYKRTYGHRQDYTRLLIEKFERQGN